MFKKIFIKFENRLIGRMWTQRFYEMLHRISIRGMNYMKGHTISESGELWAMAHVHQRLSAQGLKKPVIFDVGANKGYYAECLQNEFGTAMNTFCFEPGETSFQKLSTALQQIPGARPVQLGMGAKNETLDLHFNIQGSTIASLYPLIDLQNKSNLNQKETIETMRVEDYCRENELEKIDFLKIDVEGAEFDVLDGCGEMLENGAISYIQFEFGPNNMSSKTYMKDFFRILKNYQIYRIVQNGLRPIPEYHEIIEIPLVCNFLCEYKNIGIR